MAAIERKQACWKIASLALLLVAAPVLHADRAADVRAQVSYVAAALGNGNPTDALGPFDRSCKNYQKLKEYFGALTNGSQVTSEVEILDEQDEETETKLLVNWTLTLTSLGSPSDVAGGSSERRSADISIRLVPQKGKWKIVEFSPVDIFNPQGK